MIIVTGVGRSGTSMVAGALAKLGVYMGERFRDPDAQNISGYWEDCDFLELDLKMQSGEMSPAKFVNSIRALKQKRSTMEPWGFKDPRVADLTEYYLSIFPEAHYIWCQRERPENILSLRKQLSDNERIANMTYDMRFSKLEKHLKKDVSCLIVRYEEREKLIDTLCGYLGLTPNEEAYRFIRV